VFENRVQRTGGGDIGLKYRGINFGKWLIGGEKRKRRKKRKKKKLARKIKAVHTQVLGKKRQSEKGKTKTGWGSVLKGPLFGIQRTDSQKQNTTLPKNGEEK